MRTAWSNRLVQVELGERMIVNQRHRMRTEIAASRRYLDGSIPSSISTEEQTPLAFFSMEKLNDS
jgi:hypothetical protein